MEKLTDEIKQNAAPIQEAEVPVEASSDGVPKREPIKSVAVTTEWVIEAVRRKELVDNRDRKHFVQDFETYRKALETRDFAAMANLVAMHISNVSSRYNYECEFDHYDGVCPECFKTDGCLSIGRGHWGFCDEHKTRWHIGSNVFSSWRDQTEEVWKKNFEKLADYREVELTLTIKSLRPLLAPSDEGILSQLKGILPCLTGNDS